MDNSLKEQLAAANAAFQPHVEEQTRLSEASRKIGDEIRRLQGLKREAEAAAEASAQVSARRHLGEATDAEADAARAEADRAAAEAEGADRAITQLNRENELVNARFQASIPQAAAAQNVCNQLRAAVLLEDADRAAVEYLESVQAMGAALVRLLGYSKALERIQGAQPFAQRVTERIELPAFPALAAFRPNPHGSFAMLFGDAASVGAEADRVLRGLREEGVHI
jgi:hypothetical protein